SAEGAHPAHAGAHPYQRRERDPPHLLLLLRGSAGLAGAAVPRWDARREGAKGNVPSAGATRPRTPCRSPTCAAAVLAAMAAGLCRATRGGSTTQFAAREQPATDWRWRWRCLLLGSGRRGRQCCWLDGPPAHPVATPSALEPAMILIDLSRDIHHKM